jgi:hypothetical protein
MAHKKNVAAAAQGISLCKITWGSRILKCERAVALKFLEAIYGGVDEQ